MSLGHRKDIQGLRAFAIIGVFLFHISKSDLPNGFLGVDVFFVISGYLITSILREKYSRNNFYTTIRGFYFSRLRRIVPLAVTVILINFLASLIKFTKVKETAFKLCRETVLAATFSANLVYLLFQPDLFDESKWPIFLLHYWSLAVEMQFYIIAPFLILLIVRPNKLLSSLAITCALLFTSLFCYSQTEYFAAHCWTHLRLWEFLIGTFTYLFVQLLNKKRKINTILPTHNKLDRKLAREPKKLIITSNLFSICLLIVTLNPAEFVLTKFWLNGNLSLALSLYFTASILVLNTFVNEQEQQKLMLNHKYLVVVGDLSYPVYLVHLPIIAQFKQIVGDTNYKFELKGVLFVVIATIVAAKSLDKFVDFYFRKISDWSNLLVVLLTLYFCLFVVLIFVFFLRI